MFDGLHELAGFEKRLRRAGVQPRHAPPELHDVKRSTLEIDAVEVGDFELTTFRRPQRLGEPDHFAAVHVQPGDRKIRLRHGGLLLDFRRAARGIECQHPEPVRVLYGIGEHRRATVVRNRVLCLARQFAAEEHVVAEDQRHWVVADEVAADDEGMGEALGFVLDGVRERHPPPRAVAEEFLEPGRVLGCGDDENFAHAAEHERGQRVVDHRLVVDRQELLADRDRDGVQAQVAPAGEDDALGCRRCHAR